MLPLEQRQKQRQYFKDVYAGKVDDMAVTHGTDDAGNTLGDDLKPVISGATNQGNGDVTSSPINGGNGNGGDNGQPADYSKIRSHADANAALAGRSDPQGWGEMTVASKVAWLSGNPPPPTAPDNGGEPGDGAQDGGNGAPAAPVTDNGQNGGNGAGQAPGWGAPAPGQNQ